MPDLFEKIAGVLAFFALWNFPLTPREVQRFFSQEQISTEFLLEHFFSYEHEGRKYFSTLPDRELLQATRIKAEKYSTLLHKKAQKYGKFLQYFPFVRAIAIGNTVALGVATAESDIDLLIVAEKGHLFTVRFLTTIFFTLLRLRAAKGKTRGKFCLSFFVDTEFLNFQEIKKERDGYLAFWISTLTPLSGEEHIQKIRTANSGWIQQEIGVSFAMEKPQISQQKSWLQKFLELIFGNISERFFRSLLLKKARKFQDPASPQYAPEMIFSEQIQKLHAPDLRAEIQAEWTAQVRQFLDRKLRN